MLVRLSKFLVFEALLKMKKYFGTDGIRGTVNIGNINGEKFLNLV